MNKRLLTLLMLIVFSSCSNAQTKPSQVSAIDFSKEIKATDEAVIVDVRTPDEFRKGHLQNALNLNWNGSEFETQLATLDKKKPIFVYCLSGGRSGKAVEKMRKEGFEHIIEMPGGMMEWRANNFPEMKISTADKGMDLAAYEKLLQSDQLVLVDFYAEWCAPCKKMEPYLEKIATEMAGKVTLVRINADENAELCKTLHVAALPVLKLYKDKKVLWENKGYIDEAAIRKALLDGMKD